ncbi:hypothetical protein HPB51_000802 [Rhipicephalus microplus]|uniref:Uncharacterized protein n=1 Tax=Rhipicephalus microplus TaxID=6941 RepID=A0A9J6EKY3_RHIMP|nr:hypothetical protein HPB51_000802 [Rhipicephalus microplus]
MHDTADPCVVADEETGEEQDYYYVGIMPADVLLGDYFATDRDVAVAGIVTDSDIVAEVLDGEGESADENVLSVRIPFLLSSVADLKHHVSNGETLVVSEMASAAGLPCKVDPALVAALRSQKNDLGDDEYQVACLLMVFVAVSLPKLARTEGSVYKPSLEVTDGATGSRRAHSQGRRFHEVPAARSLVFPAHVLVRLVMREKTKPTPTTCTAWPTAVNALAGSLFTICGHDDIEDRLKEFLALASSSLLRLGQEADREAGAGREAVFLLLHLLVDESPFLTMDLLESCFPYALLRNAAHAVYKAEA